MARTHKLVISFRTKEALLDFVRDAAPDGTAAYHADALDKEFGGRVSPDTYVLRNIGAKPDAFLAVGAEA